MMSLPPEYQLDSPQPPDAVDAPGDSEDGIVPAEDVVVPAEDLDGAKTATDVTVPTVDQQVRQVTAAEQYALEREGDLLQRQLDDEAAVHDEVMSGIDAAIDEEQQHIDGLRDVYEQEEAARDRLQRLRVKRWEEQRRHMEREQALETSLLDVLRELDAAQRADEVTRSILED